MSSKDLAGKETLTDSKRLADRFVMVSVLEQYLRDVLIYAKRATPAPEIVVLCVGILLGVLKLICLHSRRPHDYRWMCEACFSQE